MYLSCCVTVIVMNRIIYYCIFDQLHLSDVTYLHYTSYLFLPSLEL